MKFSLNWLKKHIDLTVTLQDLITEINQIGLEVESVEDQQKKYNGFIIAEILDAIEHPNANSLRICKVDNGSQLLNIVCGASNARPGIKVVLAMVDAIIPNGLFQIKQSKIRGILSEGMLCSLEELGLHGNSDGILELDNNAPIGKSFAEYANLDDVIIEVALTPNRRRDCASVYGIARDLAAAECGRLKDIITINNQGNDPIISVEIEASDKCQQFNLFTSINIDQQRLNLEDVLLMQKVKTLNDNQLVNLSNFIMMDLGNPNHIYDLDKIKGDKIYVRLSQNNEKFIALGGKEYDLPAGLLVIADGEKVLSIAGVMGGELSKVDENTKNIIVEVANFKPDTVAFAAQTLSIISDSKYRFEGGIDIGSVDRATEVIRQYLPRSSNIIKVYGDSYNYLTALEISFDKIESYLGLNIDDNQIINLLDKLSFKPKSIGNRLFKLTIPSWKQGNIESYYEVIEDLLRIGLMNQINAAENNKNFISSRQVTNNMICAINNNSSENIFNPRIIEDSTGSKLRQLLISRGMNEVLTWSFYANEEQFAIESNYLNKYFFNKHSNDKELISIKNPINNKFQLMRRSLVPNLINTITLYPNNQEKSLSIFEIGNIYSLLFKGFQSITISGLRIGESLHNQEFSFYDVREDLLAILKTFGMSDKLISYSYDYDVPQYYHPTKSMRIKLGQNVLGIIGELHPKIVEELDLYNKTVAIFELFTQNIPSKLFKLQPKKELILPTQQRIYRDLSFIIDNNIMVGDLIKAINSLKEKLIDETEVYDIYHGLDGNKKSVTIKVIIQPEDNINDKVINVIIDKVIRVISDRVGGKLRTA